MEHSNTIDQVQILNDTDLTKAFYAQCLKAKLSMPRKDAAQFVPVSDLYAKCLRKNVPTSQWADWIELELAAANRRFEKLSANQRQKAKTDKRRHNRRFSNMHEIMEEEESDGKQNLKHQ